MNKEIAVRRRIHGIYNKREEDFPSLRDYNDYLEEVEDMIFGLIEGVDVAKIEEKISRYQQENFEAILASRARRAEEQAAALRAEKRLLAGGGAAAAAAASGEPAASVALQNTASQAPSGQYAPTMLLQPRPSGQPVPLGAPSLLNGNGEPEDEESRRLREERGVKAGGWTPELGRRRAYEESFNSIWVN
jgi:CDK-activating kinase assembly factor MAT1